MGEARRGRPIISWKAKTRVSRPPEELTVVVAAVGEFDKVLASLRRMLVVHLKGDGPHARLDDDCFRHLFWQGRRLFALSTRFRGRRRVGLSKLMEEKQSESDGRVSQRQAMLYFACMLLTLSLSKGYRRTVRWSTSRAETNLISRLSAFDHLARPCRSSG